MKSLKVNDPVIVTIKENSFLVERYKNQQGRIIAIAKEGEREHCIVQFKNPVDWCYYLKNELRKKE